LILNGQFDNSFGQEEQDGKQTRFFWIFVGIFFFRELAKVLVDG